MLVTVRTCTAECLRSPPARQQQLLCAGQSARASCRHPVVASVCTCTPSDAWIPGHTASARRSTYHICSTLRIPQLNCVPCPTLHISQKTLEVCRYSIRCLIDSGSIAHLLDGIQEVQGALHCLEFSGGVYFLITAADPHYSADALFAPLR